MKIQFVRTLRVCCNNCITFLMDMWFQHSMPRLIHIIINVFIEIHADVMNPMTEDGTCQTSPDLTSETPRKIKLKKAIKLKNDQIRKIKKKLTLKKKSKREKTIEQALSQLPPNMANFVKEQINLCAKKSKGRRYSPEMKTIVLSIYHASGKAVHITK